jgi:hypothetical protein
MIDLYLRPFAGGVAVGTDCTGLGMLLMLSGSLDTIMASEAGLGRILELCPGVAGLATHIHVLAGQWKTSLAVIKTGIDARIRKRCSPGERY